VTTYQEAADFAFDRLMHLTGNNQIYVDNNGFWHQGNALSTCIDYLVSSGKPDNQKIVENALNSVFDVYRRGYEDDPVQWTQAGRYGQGSWLDDYGWWGTALQQAYQSSNQLGYDQAFSARLLRYSQNCWVALQGGWDPSPVTPGPGIRGGAWNHEVLADTLSGKNCITNEGLWRLSQFLYRSGVPDKQKYADQNNNSYRWFKDAFPLKALFSKQGLVYERLVGTKYFDQCWIWTGDQGMFMAACLGNQSAGGENPGSWAYDIAQSVKNHLLDENGVVHDRSLPLKYEGFSKDYATGKGVLLRCWTAWSDPKPSNWGQLILDNAKAVWNNRVFKDDPPDPNDPTRQYQFGFNGLSPCIRGYRML
jgi:hypothetical protein